MTLRAVLAELDMKVRGLGQVDEANAAIDRYVELARPAATEAERLRVKQQEYYELTGRLGRKIKELQRAEGDHSRQIGELRLAMARAQDQAKAYGREAEKLTKELDHGTEAVAGSGGAGGFVGGMRSAAGAIAGVVAGVTAAVGSLRVFAAAMREVIELGTEMQITADAIGLSTSALQEWQFIAERANLDQTDLRQGFGDLAEKAHSGEESFRKLGIRTKDASGQLRDLDAIMTDSLRALNGVTNETERAALAQRLFGEDAGAGFAAMAKASPQLEELRRRFRELGGGISEDGVEKSVAAGDAMQEWRIAMLSFKSVLAADVLPTLTRFVSGVATFVGKFVELARSSSVVEAALGVLAVAFGALALAMAPVTIPLLIFVAMLAGLVLVVEDVITAFRGGESVFGSFVESILEAMGVTLTFRGAVDALGIGWDILKARVLGAIASILQGVDGLQDSLGLEVFEGLDKRAANATRAAGIANVRARSRAAALAANEAQRRAERQVIQMERRASASAGETKIDASSNVTINGATDPEAVRRVVREENERRLRQLADVIPEAAGA